MAAGVTLKEVKNYLRIDSNTEDDLLYKLISIAESLSKDAARAETVEEFRSLGEPARLSVLYAVTYLYENRESADYHQLLLMLRSILFGVRKEKF